MAMRDALKKKAEDWLRSGIITAIISVIIMAAVVVLTLYDVRLPVLEGKKYTYLPFVSALIGVLFYIMASARSRRQTFQLKYLSDYFFRGAQAFVYVYIIMAFIATAGNTKDFGGLTPNLIGLFTGMFILHVEKAMEGLGQRFEEVLAGVFTRSLTAKTSREKQIDKVRYEQKFREIQTQNELLASLIDSPEVVRLLNDEINKVKDTVRNGEPEAIEDAVSKLALKHEEIKRMLREETITVKDVLRVWEPKHEDNKT